MLSLLVYSPSLGAVVLLGARDLFPWRRAGGERAFHLIRLHANGREEGQRLDAAHWLLPLSQVSDVTSVLGHISPITAAGHEVLTVYIVNVCPFT